MNLYSVGQDSYATWETDIFQVLLLTSYSFSQVDPILVLDDVLLLNPEVTGVGGYSRVTTTGNIRTPNLTLNRVLFTCDNPDFSGMSAGETIDAFVLFKFVTDDTDHIPMGIQVLDTPIPTEDMQALDGWDTFVAYMEQGNA